MRVPDLVDSGLFQRLARPLAMDVDRRGVAWVRPLFSHPAAESGLGGIMLHLRL